MRAQSDHNLYPVIPLRDLVVFPGAVTSLRVGRPRSVAALDRALEGDRRLVLIAQRDMQTADPGPDDLYDVGVIVEVKAVGPPSEQGVRVIVVSCLQRCRIAEHVSGQPWIGVRVEPLVVPRETPDADLVARVRALFAMGPQKAQRISLLESLPESAALEYAIASQLDLSVADKQQILAEPSVVNRYRMLVPVLQVEGEIAQVGERLWEGEVQDVTDADRRRYLREQKQEIEAELAELGGGGPETESLRQRVEEADLPEEARAEADRELARMDRMAPGFPEYNVAEDYIDWLVSLPWTKSTEASLDVGRAREILDRDHYDRAEVKERILEYLSVRQLKPSKEGALLCLVGAPGVGKTSMGRSVAAATEREFYRVSLGGVRDEAEIRGHRRTYLGALPGSIIRALRRIGVNNPVLMLDEIDKLSMGWGGDPSSALLEVLDPEQNHAFVDNYLAVPFDLSRIMFIATANTTDTIPPVLLDRLEVIELPGYTTEEKMEIARQYLLPKQLAAGGLEAKALEIDREALELLVERYTQEAGVRNLERCIASICRKVAREYVGGRGCYALVDAERVAELLGPPRVNRERAEDVLRVGVCPTLAVSGGGAVLLLVEVLKVEGRGRILVTGRVGEVLRESALLAYSFWNSQGARFGLDASILGKWDLHVHFPQGATPKEGSSAGLPISLALASLLAGIPLPPRMAALGEVTLHGRVLPVDRLAERLAAAERCGLTHVILPGRNRAEVAGSRDLVLPESVRLTYVDTIQEAVATVLPIRAAAQAGPR